MTTNFRKIKFSSSIIARSSPSRGTEVAAAQGVHVPFLDFHRRQGFFYGFNSFSIRGQNIFCSRVEYFLLAVRNVSTCSQKHFSLCPIMVIYSSDFCKRTIHFIYKCIGSQVSQPPPRGIPQGDTTHKQQNQADRIGLPNFISYAQKITGVTR